MFGVVVEDNGEKIYIGEYEKPKITKRGCALVKIHASAINRADIMQRYGKYPPPPGASSILGLEMSGVIEEIVESDEEVYFQFKVGDRVCGLLTGGGYAEYCVLPLSHLLPIPPSLSFIDGAGMAEAYLTAFQSLFYITHIDTLPTHFVLIHASGSGVGVAAIQLIHSLYPEIKVIATAGSDDKLNFAKSIGANYTLNYKNKNNKFADEIMTWTEGKGVDVIVDFVGASYWDENLISLGEDGRMVILSLLGGPVASSTALNLILRKRLTITGSTLRSRSDEYKSNLTRDFYNKFYQFWEEGKIKVYVDQTFPLSEIDRAHQYVSDNKNTGKVILLISPSTSSSD